MINSGQNMMNGFNIKTGQLFALTLFLILSSCGTNPEKSQQLLDEGVEFYYHAQYANALNRFNNSIDENPENFEAWFWLGNYYENNGKHTKAIELYGKAIKLNPNYTDAFSNRAKAKKNFGDNKGACTDWRKAAELGKHNLDDNLKWCKRNGF